MNGRMEKSSLLAAARGEQPADLLLRNGKIVNVFTGLVEQGDIAVWGDRIAGIGPGYAAQQEIDLHGAYVTPGLIDAHVHIESSLLVPAQFAAAVLPHGVTSIVADPHEIGNVAGVAGIRYMAAACAGLPLSVFLMAPSCVPATAMESNGARLEAEDLAPLLQEGLVHGLAEMMNYPGVTGGDPAILAKLEAFRGRPVDGHAPGWLGKALNAYVAAGIDTEHECTSVAEAQEKLGRGLYILIRQATNAQNLRTLLPLVTPSNSRRICFCTDDRVPADLLDEGSIDFMVRQAIDYGIDPLIGDPDGDAQRGRMLWAPRPRRHRTRPARRPADMRRPARSAPATGVCRRAIGRRSGGPAVFHAAALHSPAPNSRRLRQRRMACRRLPHSGTRPVHAGDRLLAGPACDRRTHPACAQSWMDSQPPTPARMC